MRYEIFAPYPNKNKDDNRRNTLPMHINVAIRNLYPFKKCARSRVNYVLYIYVVCVFQCILSIVYLNRVKHSTKKRNLSVPFDKFYV